MHAEDHRSTLRARIRVPDHVVYRNFDEETVILNLETGMYHGLNPTAAQMLEEIQRSDSVAAAAEALVEQFGQPPAVIERDLLGLCQALEERGLVVRDDA